MKKRYNDGGMPDYEREPDFEDKGQQSAEVAAYKVSKGMDPNKSGEEEHMDAVKRKAVLDKPLAKASFKEAFAEARAAGDKTFEYMGKKYSTAVAGPSFKDKAKSSGFAAAETKGGAALMTRKDRMKDKPMAKMAKGGSVSSASKRGDGCAIKGKTRGRMV
jgi:hypothetical protein